MLLGPYVGKERTSSPRSLRPILFFYREDKKESRLKKRLNDSENQHDQQQQNNKRIRLTTPSPSESPTRVGFFQNLDQLREHVACTWKGVLMLKKSEYPLRFC